MKKSIFPMFFCALLLCTSTTVAMQKKADSSALSIPSTMPAAPTGSLTNSFANSVEKCGDCCKECLFSQSVEECTKNVPLLVPFSICALPDLVVESGPEGFYASLAGLAILGCGCAGWSALCAERRKKEHFKR